MRGKIVNSVVAGMNLFFGLLVLLFNFYLPSISRASTEELKVITEINRYILALTIVVAIINLITLICNRKDKILLFTYILAIFSSCFYFVHVPYIGVLYILSALMVIIQMFRENMIYMNNTFYIVVVAIVMIAIGLLGLNILTYKDKVKKIVKEESKGYLEYNTEYFKNISILGEDNEFYLNVERDGKWGYINKNGETKIEFKYDYASPFVTITMYDKDFDIALVCQDDTASIILKNQRTVMSFRNDIALDNYQKQIEKLQELYTGTFNQSGKITEKFSKIPTSSMNTIKAYDKYPYRYPFNDEYDIYITVSQTGTKNRYEFMKKDNSNIKVSIDCDNLKFDGNNLYVYSNGYLPFYKTSENKQGWYTKETKRVELEGNIQILEFFEQYILIKDYDKEIIYFANENGERVSDEYKDIFVLDDAYIVKNMDNKYIIVNKEFQQMLDIEYDYINPMLLNQGILICANLPAKVNFNSSGFPSNLQYDLVDLSGNKISLKNADGTVIDTPAYSQVYYIDNKKNVSSYDTYINNLTNIDYEFIGEEFYKK